ncbi:MAG: gliding motility-associated protein GldE [Bacteroidetes bacterium]|nr:gliding motility-associated protein GldE [Bacteroidota bacterium]
MLHLFAVNKFFGHIILLDATPMATNTILFFVLIIFFLLSFLMSGADIAYFSLSVKDINMLKTRSHPSYKRIVNMLENPRLLQISILISNWVLNLGIIIIGELFIRQWLGQFHLHILLDMLIKVIIIATAIIIFCEMIPKIWAANHKIWFASTASLPVEIANIFLGRLSNRVLRMTGSIEGISPLADGTRDELHLDDAIDLLPDNEASKEEKQILKGIRKFGNTTVKQAMRTRLDVSGISANADFEQVLIRIREMNYSRLPVYNGNLDEIKGILHTKDLLPYLNLTQYDWLTLLRPAFYIHEQKLIEDLLQDFRNKRMHLAVVVDEFGGTSGIITLEDIMEEIVGDIQDEFDDEQSPNKKIDDQNYIFEGKTMIPDLCRMLDIPQNTFDAMRGDSDSVAGLLLEIAGEFPAINDTVKAGDYTFTILDINKNRIQSVKVTLPPSKSKI